MNLETQLRDFFNSHPQAFPDNGTVDYSARYTTLSQYLNQHIHPSVEKASLAKDLEDIKQVIEDCIRDDKDAVQRLKEWKDKGIPAIVYLTDHGPKHIEMVIQRASRLISALRCNLTPYETYILLCAIHFHDVGNMQGRDGHEARIGEVIESERVRGIIPDVRERKVIKKIAAAHGGSSGGQKDTIGILPEAEYVSSCGVRMQYLAAVLRFADELADDRTRADRFLLENPNPGKKYLSGSEVYHKYASHLETLLIEEKRVSLNFSLSSQEVTNLFAKGNSQRYLVDEIFERTLKMHIEAVYCMRFVRSSPQPKSPTDDNANDIQSQQSANTVDTIKVSIEVFHDFADDEPLYIIEYSLKEAGYPQYIEDIHKICPDINKNFKEKHGHDVLCGSTLRDVLVAQVGTP